jgi:hypothetical protein
LEITQNVIPTFPPPRLGVENWKTKSRFPTFPLVVLYLFQNRTKKGGLAADRFAPTFRLILGLENAGGRRQEAGGGQKPEGQVRRNFGLIPQRSAIQTESSAQTTSRSAVHCRLLPASCRLAPLSVPSL